MQLRGQGKATLLLTGMLMAGPALAHKAGDVIVRLGGIKVDPDASSETFNPALPAVGGLGVDVDDDTQLGLTLAYMVTDSFGIELVGATPFTHDILLDTGGGALPSVKPVTCRPRCWRNTMHHKSGPCGLMWGRV